MVSHCFPLSLQEEEGICTHKLFSEDGLIKLLEQAAPLFREVTRIDVSYCLITHSLSLSCLVSQSQLYEAACEVYKLVTPIYHHKRLHRSMESIYNKMAECMLQATDKEGRQALSRDLLPCRLLRNLVWRC